jgi:hypothetical protein
MNDPSLVKEQDENKNKALSDNRKLNKRTSESA